MSDIIRVGYISNVNYAEGTAQVVYKDRDNAVSPYLPFASIKLVSTGTKTGKGFTGSAAPTAENLGAYSKERNFVNEDL